MLIKRASDIKGGEITDQWLYVSRRRFMAGAAALALAPAVAGGPRVVAAAPPALGAAQARRPNRLGQVRRVLDARRPRPVPRPEEGPLQLRRARLALHRGPAPRRGAPPADPPHGGHVRPGAAEPERRADPRGGA